MQFINVENRGILIESTYPNYREKVIKSAGTQIVLSLYDAHPQDPYILFLPGTMTHPLFYDEFLSSLATNRFNVIGIHFLSHGKSPRDKKDYTLDDMIRNVIDTISFIITKYGKSPILLGTSQGGILSLAVAARDHRIKAIFAHNAMLPQLKESFEITKFPKWMGNFNGAFQSFFKALAKIAPTYQIPVTGYLDPKRIFIDKKIEQKFLTDPIGLTSYPASFLSSLFTADFSGVTDGEIQCPVIMIASTKDPLFSYEYSRKVYELIKAPKKEMLVFDEPNHLLFNECIDQIEEKLIQKIKEYCSLKNNHKLV